MSKVPGTLGGSGPCVLQALVTACLSMKVAVPHAWILGGWLVIGFASARTQEYRSGWAEEIKAVRSGSTPRWFAVANYAVFVPYMLAVLLTPIVIVLGLAPDLEAALYYAAVVLILLGAGWALLGLVFAERVPESASRRSG